MRIAVGIFILFGGMLYVCQCAPSYPSHATDGDDDLVELPSPCDGITCEFGDCQTVDGLAYCNCPDDYHRVGYIHCVPNNADGDVDIEADRDPDVDLTDAATEKVTRTFSHYMDAEDPKLQPGETRVTAGPTGYGSTYATYDVNDDWVVYCTWDYRIIACRLDTGACFNYDILDVEADCDFPSLLGNTLYANLILPTEIPEKYDTKLLQLDLITLEADYNQPAYWDVDSMGNHVVWAKEDGLPSENGLFVYDIQTHETSVIPGSNSPHSRWPRTSEKYLIWQQSTDSDSTGNASIKLYEYATGQISLLTSNTEKRKWMPSVGERYAAWTEFGIDDPEPGFLKIWDIQEQKFVSSPVYDGRKHNPQVWEDRIIFLDYRDDWPEMPTQNTDVYLRDLGKNIEIPLCTVEGQQGYLRTYGRWVLWSDNRWPRNDNAPYDIDDIVLFDLCSLELYKSEDWCQ